MAYQSLYRRYRPRRFSEVRGQEHLVSALRNDPQRFLERNAKLQWGIMVCVYGLSHVPALLLLQFPRWLGNNAFLVFFLVLVVQTCMLVQHLAARGRRKPVAPAISASFHWQSWGWGLLAGGLVGGLLAGVTPFKPVQAVAMSFSGDPWSGLRADRFSGSAIVFVGTATFVRTRTASLD